MSRRLKIKTHEMGDLELYVIYQYGDELEDTWKGLGEPVVKLVSYISKEDFDHALAGWSWPLTSKLGIPPEGALRKLPYKVCNTRGKCPFYNSHCVATSEKVPWCFEVEGVQDDTARRLASQIIQFWKEGVYTLVVQETS